MQTLTPSKSRLLPVPGVRNLRDLGGYRTHDGRHVKCGKLFRSAELSGLTPEGQQYLADRVHVIVDLRTTAERTELVTPAISGVDNLHLPIFEQGGHDNNITRAVAAAAERDLGDTPMIEINREFVTSALATASYQTLIDQIIAAPEDKAVLWHCTAGKDRTGMAALILLVALGVDFETIYQDYLATNEHLKEHVENIVNAVADPKEAEVMRGFWVAKRSYLDAAIDEMNKVFGSPEGYLRDGLGLDDQKLSALRNALLV